MAIEVPQQAVSVTDAVATYLFNSQLLSHDDGRMTLVLPQESQEHAGVWRYLNDLLAQDNPISALQVFDLRESMANGGGPACLRLRVVLSEAEQRAVNPAVMMNDTLFAALSLNCWISGRFILFSVKRRRYGELSGSNHCGRYSTQDVR